MNSHEDDIRYCTHGVKLRKHCAQCAAMDPAVRTAFQEMREVRILRSRAELLEACVQVRPETVDGRTEALAQALITGFKLQKATTPQAVVALIRALTAVENVHAQEVDALLLYLQDLIDADQLITTVTEDHVR